MSAAIEYAPCPACGQSVALRQDGSPSRHFQRHRGGLAARERQRCPAGERGARWFPEKKGRRVVVTVDVVIPAGMTVAEFAADAAALLRERAAEGFVVGVTVTEAEAAS